MTRTRDTDLTLMIVIFVGGMTLVSWFSEQPLWLRTAVIVFAFAAATGWWTLLRMPTTCGVANRSNARGCSNNVKGLLRACWLADHRARKQKLLWARLLRRSPSLPPVREAARRPASPAGVTAPAAMAEPGTGGYHLESAGYRATILVCTLVSTFFGGVSGVAAMVSMLSPFAD